jgi:tellurite resistance protein TerC
MRRLTEPEPAFAFIEGPEPWGALAVVTVGCLWLDMHFFARGRRPTLREGALWSAGWLVLSLLVALVVWAVSSGDDAVTYTTVYFIERSLSLDNLFVFLLLFGYFAIPEDQRAGLLFWGIAAALALRGLAILGGVALIEQFEFVLYVLGALLLVLAWRILRGVEENVDPGRNVAVRSVRWAARGLGRPEPSAAVLCLAAIVAADIAFAVDSIPAAFGITRDAVLIWMANVFALLGMRALFVLVEELVARFRYLDATIAVVLGLVGVKLLLDKWVHVDHVTSLAIVAACFAVGIGASMAADRRRERV